MVLSGTIGVAVTESGAAPFTVAFARCLVGGLLLVLWCAARGWLRPGRLPLGGHDLGLAALGAVLLVGNWVLLFAAYGRASLSVATVVYHTQPFLLLGLAVAVLGERVARRDLGFGAVAFCGVALIALGGQGVGGGRVGLDGVAMALGAALLYAGWALVAKRQAHVRPEVLAAVQCCVGAVLLAPTLLFAPLPPLGAGWGWLALLGVVHTALMYVLMFASIGRLSTATVAVLSFLYPAVALVFDVVLYGHRVGVAEGAGMVAVLAAAVGHKLPARRTRGRSRDRA
ncbi:Threonine/homoserine efflux transporter RhtA [Streptoalloteichus tenebrarius]|uniref:Threonine/homoserine efflux transporter RhtA n=2 Tax=Streptoalloteichus tenebrarius (strain ATCC 17920 / DSM 40477 / JCM 4838 / CBS 697.72 / NBRC 16177 / NCIMB 11028 / NRRL B-12390 / A12253. 1 / ISP 5477) TaxID=1933 RepID=A0ABT1HX39_STRSD|nr:DMT family transporter [Streptoalloteichus tenebrarius]MCP2260087.1 Threonine/homoserine efflux transporter RhtA [Streptoalloteichus tenebrarius]BFF00594.1 DMT family transporter [Streptoalloteichus tenebrarius]